MVSNKGENSNFSLNDFQNMQRRIIKASELLMNPPDIDVGTAPCDVVYQEGKMKLLHYHPKVKKTHDVPLLIIYALINKPYILDLQPDRSVIRTLLSEGFDIYMIDWGTPTEADRFMTLDDYVNWYINDAVDFIREKHDMDSISLLGYCMGGTLSVMFTAIHPEKVRNFIVMAAPLDFKSDPGLLKLWSKKEYFDADKLVDIVGNVSGEFLNFGYLLLDPVNNLYSKYLKFIDKVDDDEFVKMFFRMEKWINDGIPVAGEAFREFISKLYQENQLVNNQLRLNGYKVDLKKIDMPLLSLVAKYDHLVPPESSMSFNDLVGSKDKKMMVFPTGHIGLSVSSATRAKLWPEVALWLRKRSDIKKKTKKRPKKKERPKRPYK
ncbi:MAG: class III poly(R)-hydroxyalkanoic acid synthase subunit PhaC [Thermoplasmata archaeon]|nr:MAG: class III poly(R)-hydroxyalkanoic acid synthase subunit PhaC [Thermoplasmata archaeon]